jgi:selenocysteine-specific elongation factor
VLDIDVPARGRRSEARLDFLRVAARGDARATLLDAIETSAKGVDLDRWNVAHNSAFAAADVPAHAVGHATAGITLFAGMRWDAMRARVVDVLAAEHERAPDTVGPGRDRLRRMAAPSLPATTFAALVDALKTDGRLAQTGAWLHLPAHRVEMSAEDRRRFAQAALLLRAPADVYNPPRVRDIARAMAEDEAAIRGLFVRLASRGEVYRIAHDHYFLPDTVRALACATAEVARADGVARAAPFRDRISVGRKVAIQILEFFDRVGYTRRIGDDHRIIQPSLFDA